MALRPLAGPFPLVNDQGEAPTFLQVWGWYPHVGLILDTGDFRCVAAMDGIYQPITPSQPFPVHWWPEEGVITTAGHLGSPVEYRYEPMALVRSFVPNDPNLGGWTIGYSHVRLVDRRLYLPSSRISSIVNGVVATEGPSLPFFSGTVLAGRRAPINDTYEVFIAENTKFSGTDTRALFYNTVDREISSPIYHLGIPCEALVYAPEFDVLVSVHKEPFALRIWSLEAMPVALSAPILIAGDTVTGLSATFQVQVTGDEDEGVADQLVNWMLMGAGTLEGTQSKTDIDGYATMKVRYGVGEAGPSTVEVTVLC